VEEKMPRELGGKAAETVAQALENTTFPADREQLLAEARRRHAPIDIVGIIERLPQHTYSSMADLRRAVGKAVESLRHPQSTSSRKIGHVLDEE
jgi:Protein of unknown function (DUF2795)